MSNESACLGLHFKPYKTSQIVLTVEKEIFEVGLCNFRNKFGVFSRLSVSFIFAGCFRKLTRVSNERAYLGLHFKPYKTSQLAVTVEKNVFEVGRRNLFFKSSTFEVVVTKIPAKTVPVLV